MNALASYMACPKCQSVTLHTPRGCCHHESAPSPKPASQPHRTSIPLRLGRPASLTLTTAERRVAELLAAGHTQAEIAAQLGIRRNGVNSMVKRARDRVGAESTQALARMVSRGEA